VGFGGLVVVLRWFCGGGVAVWWCCGGVVAVLKSIGSLFCGDKGCCSSVVVLL